MVNQGPSRGCSSCRLRRKKCDGTRPSCMRCLRAKRSCGGYDETAFSAFRQYATQNTTDSPSFVSTARKCSLPMRVPLPGTDILPEDSAPSEISEAKSDEFALRAFFYDYCIVPANPHLSRGFFSGLETMAKRLGPESNLVEACRAVGFASHGRRLHWPRIVHRAEMLYQELLGSLARAMESPNLSDARESRLVATLLGLYQMTIATEADKGDHEAHAKGLAVMMNITRSPLDLLDADRRSSIPYSNTNLKGRGIFSIPALSDGDDSLDDLITDLHFLWQKSEESLSSQNSDVLKSKALSLDRRFSQWQDSRTLGFKPTVNGNISPDQNEAETAVGYWPGNVDTYFDLYTASVWNIFRVARLLLIALNIKISSACGETYSTYAYTARRICEEIISSIPFHLSDNLLAFVNELPASKEIKNPGRLIGGLLLMHPLYVASRMTFLPETMRDYMRRCLLWIGSNMGLGQATLLANSPDIDTDYLASGCLIIWSGFLE